MMKDLGAKAFSYKEMCEAYNLSIFTFYDRRKRGWTLQECLTGKSNP